MLRNDDFRIPPAGHLGMPDDKAFMDREDWLGQDGGPFCKVFCPVTLSERNKRLKGNERLQFAAEQDEGELESHATQVSALALRYDWDLHQMVAYMRRLDGATETLRRQPRMDPMGKLGNPKWATDGSRTPFFGYWFYIAWDNVFAPVLCKAFGQSVDVLDDGDVDELLGATVMM
jgi:hypothetical protein